MKYSFKITVLLLFYQLAIGQTGFIYGYTSKFGPCNTYLNILGYHYSFNEMRKDTLKYEADDEKFGAIFVQNKTLLLSAELFDKKGRKVSSGNLTNGNGQLIINRENDSRYIFNFKNGKLNDSALYYVRGRLDSYSIYNDNFPVKRMTTFLGTKTFTNYDSTGIVHDSTLHYGYLRTIRLPFYSRSYDSYKGKVRQVNIYEHGQIKELIIYKKNGAIKFQEKYKVIPRNYAKKYHKKLFVKPGLISQLSLFPKSVFRY